jgi:two-component sensor histidine kinase
VTLPVELALAHAGLDTAERLHLERLMASWGLLADFSFSDLLLYVSLDHASPTASDAGTAGANSGHFLVFGQLRPTTNPTLFEQDLVGQVIGPGELPLLEQCARRETIMSGERPDQHGATVRYECIPVRFHDKVLAVLTRVWSPTLGRRTGGLERVYVQLYERLAEMVFAGIFPFENDDEAIEEAPRVGDGVIVLDAAQQITFASPNAVNALHRMGIVSAIIGSRLGELGLRADSVAEAFARREPVIEEVERRPDVVVMLRTIPLISDDVVDGAALLCRDVTDLRRRDRLLLSKDAAIREVHHRVKNNLQTISSLLRLQSRRLDDQSARDALLESERRIRAIALVHEILAREPGDQVPFGEIVPALIDLARDIEVSRSDLEIHAEGDLGEVTADVATPLAVVIAELLQNAVEHAFNKSVAGAPRVDLDLRRDGAVLFVEVRDNGSGFDADFDLNKTKSLGLAIVRDLVRSQLGGTIAMGNDGGAVVRLAVPISQTAPGALEHLHS